jgi:preprotein translocase subunit secB
MTSQSNDSNRASFRLEGYRIGRSEIGLKIAGETLRLEKPEELHIDIDPEGSALLKENKLLVLKMNTRVYSDSQEVDIKVSLVAHFSYKTSGDEGQLDKYIAYNAPAIIFPYVRAYISSLTGLSGIPPIVLPTLNMEQFGKDLLTLLNKV